MVRKKYKICSLLNEHSSSTTYFHRKIGKSTFKNDRLVRTICEYDNSYIVRMATMIVRMNNIFLHT